MNKLDELTIWALYILAFNEEQRYYIKTLHSIALKKVSLFNPYVFEDRVKLASIKAIELYKPQWSWGQSPKGKFTKEEVDDIKSKIEFSKRSYITKGYVVGNKTEIKSRKKEIESLRLKLKEMGEKEDI